MALDVTSSEVHGLLNSLGDQALIDLSAQIDAANLIVTEDLAGSGLSDDRQRLISLYLAAHFATITLYNGGLTHLETGQSVEKYVGTTQFDQGLTRTNWGQQAVILDGTGTLAQNASPKLKAEFRVVGSKMTRTNPQGL